MVKSSGHTARALRRHLALMRRKKNFKTRLNEGRKKILRRDQPKKSKIKFSFEKGDLSLIKIFLIIFFKEDFLFFFH